MNTKKAKIWLNRRYIHALNMMASCLTRVEKKIAFESYKGRQYSDNPRFISEKMHELYPDYRIVWGIQKDVDIASFNIPEYVQVYPIDSWSYRTQRASSFALVRNEAMTGDLYKRKGQIYIQTWHGDRGIKKILYDSLAARKVSEKTFSFTDREKTDLFVVGSDYAEKRIKTAFRYEGKVLKCGCPRNDCLAAPNGIEKIKDRLGLDADVRVLLYAPTLRRNNKIVQSTIDINDVLCHLSARGEKWVCLVRAHPKSLGIDVHSTDSIVDVTSYPDMADLLMIADFLITDYSSCAGDFIIKKKPLILAQLDLEQYMEEDRTFYVDINEIGFLIARTQEELDSFIDNLSDEDYAENCQKVMDYFGTHETGHAAEDVCKWIDAFYQSK